ncbi:hypothetical protein HPL003_12495 [Paenibacillus terrae HPL-003]|uniref:Uncharacterized protein n=1 Tax=Paenibacillus terrae (strain HPL-003) TaxID=985665 RepID=G7W414_PAETH|nr:hypothetical protein [Paenibacillus terrae]AET59254.1 hypothetical protein HPL003_12495 [Paenibacillus terrae HPL-003]
MKLAVTVKSLGKRKPELAKQEMELNPAPETLRELIAATVALNVRRLREKQESVALIPFLTGQEVQAQGETGKVGFGSIYNDGVPDVEDAVTTAMQAFEDGLYRVFVRDEEATVLDAPLLLEEGNEIVFIRFTMLAGSLW